jgi:ATP-dependent HslUV protease subunit HslV
MALAAARALIKYSTLSASEIVKEALTITSKICVYTNDYITVEKIKI